MTMWGFSSRKEQDSSTASTDNSATGDPNKQLSPSKRSRRRIGRRRGGGEKGSDNNNDGEAPLPQLPQQQAGKRNPGPLNFTRSNGSKTRQHQQAQPNEQAALRTSSKVMNLRENQSQLYDQQQDINVDTTDAQGIEILLDLNSSHHPNNNYYNMNNNQNKTPKSPAKAQVHHSRRSMSTHKQGRRSAPPDPKRPDQFPVYTISQRGSDSPVVSLEQDILPVRAKIYRAQFSVFFPVPTRGPLLSSEQRRHRIPLGGKRYTNILSYTETVQMLMDAEPVDEMTSVRLELKKTKEEMDALEEDKEALEQRWLSLNQQQQRSFAGGAKDGSNRGQVGQQPVSSGFVDGVDWDIHRLLNSKRKMNNQERADLEQKRGRCITVLLQNPRSEDAFLAKCCGAKQTLLKKPRQKAVAVTMDPNNCRQGGAGATIRHLALLPRGSSFFVSRDNGKSYSWGQLPSRLLQRIKSQGLDPVTHCGDLMYLSTGPNGYYFAEFRSGECWWGCAGEDKEFYEILQQWDIYRVVFGSTMTHTAVDENNQTRDIITNSWIILGRDGRAAWKNLPSRLHQTLERRLANSAAPAEVALGSGDSYYVRFLDGTVDYCLPAELASVCEHIQRSGGTITDMALHPEVSHEFLIRHTELPSRS